MSCSQELVRRKKQEFASIEKEIEIKLAEEDERERRNNDLEEEDEEEEDQPSKRRGIDRAGAHKGDAQVENQKSGSNLHLNDHGEYGVVWVVLLFRFLIYCPKLLKLT